MKEKPKVPHINARVETVHKLSLFREGFAKRRASSPRPASTSGKSAKMGISYRFAAKTSSLSRSQEYGSSLGSTERTSYLRR